MSLSSEFSPIWNRFFHSEGHEVNFKFTKLFAKFSIALWKHHTDTPSKSETSNSKVAPSFTLVSRCGTKASIFVRLFKFEMTVFVGDGIKKSSTSVCL